MVFSAQRGGRVRLGRFLQGGAAGGSVEDGGFETVRLWSFSISGGKTRIYIEYGYKQTS